MKEIRMKAQDERMDGREKEKVKTDIEKKGECE